MIKEKQNPARTGKTPATKAQKKALDDGFYAALMEAHSGLDQEESARLNARLVLVLANAVGDRDTVLELLDQAGGMGR